MEKYELLEKISKRLLTALENLNLDNSGYRCIEEIEDQIADLNDILYNYVEGEDFYCKDCHFFEIRVTAYIGEWPNCRFHNWPTRWLYICPHQRGKVCYDH
jgi:hypothetical protein